MYYIKEIKLSAKVLPWRKSNKCYVQIVGDHFKSNKQNKYPLMPNVVRFILKQLSILFQCIGSRTFIKNLFPHTRRSLFSLVPFGNLEKQKGHSRLKERRMAKHVAATTQLSTAALNYRTFRSFVLSCPLLQMLRFATQGFSHAPTKIINSSTHITSTASGRRSFIMLAYRAIKLFFNFHRTSTSLSY